MRNTTLRLEEETIGELDEEADEHGLSRSEYLRMLIRTRHEHDERDDEYGERIAERDERIEDLEQELDAKDARIDELRSELQAANRRIDDVNDVIDDTRTIARTQQREQMLEERQKAVTIFRRAWWAVAGNPHARRAVRDADSEVD